MKEIQEPNVQGSDLIELKIQHKQEDHLWGRTDKTFRRWLRFLQQRHLLIFPRKNGQG